MKNAIVAGMPVSVSVLVLAGAALLAGCDRQAPGDAAGAGPGQQQQLPPMPPPLDTQRLQAAQIIDQNGFKQPMVAVDLQIPAGWSTVGGITWNDGTPCVSNQLQVNWTAFGPDSLTAVGKLPGFGWQVAGTAQQFNPCPSAPMRSAREFLEATAMKLRPGAQVKNYQDVTAEALRSLPKPPGPQVRWDAGRLLIAYADNGIAMEEVLTAAVSFTNTQGSIMGGTGVIDTHRAPAGRLDPALVQRIGATVRTNPQWQKAMAARMQASVSRYHAGVNASINDWHNREMAMINARGAADRHAIRMRTNQEVAGIYGAIAANTSATNDRMHQRTLEGIGEYNRYKGVDGTTVRNSIHNGPRVFQDTSNPNNAYSTDQPYATPPSGHVELERQR